MPTILEYKCPCCGGKIEFDSSLQQMKCPYCDSTFDVESLKGYDEVLKEERQQPQEDMSWQTRPGSEWSQDEAAHMSVYTCNSCGGEIVADETTAATHCPFCGNPVVMTGRLAGDLKPDLVIPFKLDKNAAKEALKRHTSGKTLLPKLFRSENHLDEVKGVYVPFWLFDADVDANIRYHATRTRVWSDSRYNYTETSHFSLLRAGCIAFDGVPVDGSSKMADDLMESIEPFDLNEAVDFQTAYLSGYLADRYDVTAEQSIARANARIRKSTEDAFAGTTDGYATVVPESSNLQLFNGKARYALYPVWLLSTSWQGKNFLFAVNGQTGKIVGDLPMDKAAYWRWWAIWTAILGALSFAVLLILRLTGFI